MRAGTLRVLAVGGLMGLSAALPGAAAAGAAPAPALRISIDNGRTAAQPGDQVRYTIEVRNTGTAAVPGMRVTQSVPAGLRLLSADRGGTVRAGQVRWTVTVPPGRAERFRTTGVVGSTPAQLLRLATVACALLPRETVPTVCATHSDQLPAGAAAPPAAPAGDGARSGAVPAAVGAAVLGALAVLAALVRRRSRRGPGDPAGSAGGAGPAAAGEE